MSMAPESDTPPATNAEPTNGWFRFRQRINGPILGLIIVLGIFLLLVGIKGELGTFFSLANLQVLVHGNTIPAIVALGSLAVMVSGGIDLSVGSVVALVTVVTMQVFRHTYFRTESQVLASVLAVAAGLAVGGLCGLVNGLIISGLRVPPFVTTLGMLSIARGLAIWISKGQTLSLPSGVRPAWVVALSEIASPHLLFDPGFWSLVILAVGTAVLLKRTVLGRYCYAIGSNEATARLCGIPIGRSKILLYSLAGMLTGWAGILSFARISGNPSSNAGLELLVIAGVVIGGASLRGGRGTVIGTMLGILILGVLENGVSAFDVPVEVKYILIGGIIIANTAMSQLRSAQED
ncbi:MAG TPA: ABC transporter permease [Gemmataceae bacterium]|nr:ABC transporter permease [Gemmataceae bacterium]